MVSFGNFYFALILCAHGGECSLGNQGAPRKVNCFSWHIDLAPGGGGDCMRTFGIKHRLALCVFA